MPTSYKDMTDEVIAATELCDAPNWDTSGFKKLLDAGWNINENLGNMGDALIRAVMANKSPLVAFCLHHGANPNLNLHAEEFTAIEMAPNADADVEIVSLLIKNGAAVKGRSAILHAAQKGRVDIMDKLHDAGASVDDIPDNPDVFVDRRKQVDWGTPLHGAAGNGQAKAVKWLLQKGASKEKTNFLGLTPKDVAEQKGYEECVKLLT